MKKSFMLGLAASLFFSFTFILNRQMNLSGGKLDLQRLATLPVYVSDPAAHRADP